MKLALAVWDDLVSPLLDTAGHLAVFEVNNGQVVSREDSTLTESCIVRRAAAMADTGAEVIICGAVSNALMFQLGARGIKLIPWIAGKANEVVAAFLDGELPSERFLMPGSNSRNGLQSLVENWEEPDDQNAGDDLTMLVIRSI